MLLIKDETIKGLSEFADRELTFRDGTRWARVFVARRGGCLHIGEIDLRDLSNSRRKIIDTTSSPEFFLNGNAVNALWNKHLGAAA